MTKQEKLYNVLKPFYKKAGVDKRGKTLWDVTFKKIGEADSVEEAKEMFKESNPVLEAKTAELYAELTKEQDFGYQEYEGAGYA